MDRFFSKLDLRDIKIDPFKTSFPPDAEEEPVDDAPAGIDLQPAPRDERDGGNGHAYDRRPHVPAWAAPVANGYGRASVTEVESVAEVAEVPEVADAGAAEEAAAAEPAVAAAGEVLKVSARSRPSAVAGAIAGVVRETGRAEVQAIGAGATNQAVKAVAIARDYLRETGIEAVCLPAFIDVTIDNEDRTAIRLVVEPR